MSGIKMSSTISIIVDSDIGSWVVSTSYRNKSAGREITLGLIFPRLTSPRFSAFFRIATIIVSNLLSFPLALFEE